METVAGEGNKREKFWGGPAEGGPAEGLGFRFWGFRAKFFWGQKQKQNKKKMKSKIRQKKR